MKTIITSTIIAISLAVVSVGAMAKQSIPSSTEKALVKVCQAIATGNKIDLKRAVNKTGIKYRYLLKDLRCNGMDPINFALHHRANENADYLAKRGNIATDSLVAYRVANK